jgi:lipid-A-disaccharide synthase
MATPFSMPNAQPSGPSILLVAGDVSGDVHIAALARRLLANDPNLTLHALGGRRVRKIVIQSPNGHFLGDTTNCSAIGISSALKIYFRCRRLGDRLLEFVRTHHVDLAVLCDWGGFNGRVLQILHARGIRSLYYFPPRSWERTGSGGLGIVPYVTRVATPFQWSAERLRKAGACAEWVGHPSLERVPALEDRAALRREFGVGPDDKLVALLPGSRASEIRSLAPRMAKAGAIVNGQMRLQLIAVVPRELSAEARSYLPASVRIVNDCAMQLLLASDAAIVKTGTATLEAALAGTPQVAIYDASMTGRIEWCLLWAWQRIPFIAMPNIILQREAVPELIGLKCQPANIARALMRLLGDEAERDKMLRDYALIRRALGSELVRGPTERTAEIVEEMLSEVMEPAEAESVVT